MPDLERDTIFLLKPDFEDPAWPNQRFYCWHCALIDGVLGSFPDLLAGLDIRHINWPRPRHDVIALLGEDHQSLPVMILKSGDTSSLQTGTANGGGRAAALGGAGGGAVACAVAGGASVAGADE